MSEWWSNLLPLNQGLYIAAGSFSLIFLWQFISALVGLGGAEADVELDADIDVDGLDLDDIEVHSLEEAGETVAAFKVLSLRAILAFCTMFSWAGAMYLDRGKTLSAALLLALAWGAGGWLLVAALLNWLRKLAETGTQRLATCVGRAGTVYLNIPQDGQGEVRTLVSGRVTVVKARSADGEIAAGRPVRVRRTLDATTIEVELIKHTHPDAGPTGGKETEQ